MKSIEEVYEILNDVLPIEFKKMIMFCEVEEKAYEIFYYVYFSDGSCKQCFELEEENRMDGNILDKGFEKIATSIRDSKEYDNEKRNVVTIIIDESNKSINIKQFNKSDGLYKIKKSWKEIYL